jgi:hypothetical protein
VKIIVGFLLICSFSVAWSQQVKKPELLAYKPRPKGVVTSEAVAQAGSYVVTSREVLISHIIDQAMSTPIKKNVIPERKKWLLDEKSEDFAKHLAQILLEVTVQFEAENFSVGSVSDEDVAVQEKHVDEQVKGYAAWKDLEVTVREAQLIILRKLRAKNYLKFRMESSGVQVSDEDAKAYYEKNRVKFGKFGNAPFPQFKEGIKEVLAQEQLQEKLKEWFEGLRRKYRVRYLGQAG